MLSKMPVLAKQKQQLQQQEWGKTTPRQEIAGYSEELKGSGISRLAAHPPARKFPFPAGL